MVHTYTTNQIKNTLESKGYKWFNDDINKGFDVNIVAVRNSDTGDKVTNLFDDYITVSYKENGIWKTHTWEATTDPGKRSTVQFSNPLGVARLVPGQYRGSHMVRKHNGKYTALGQKFDVPVKVYRDNDKDSEFDEEVIDEGIFGINVHKAGQKSTWVENWSAGCMVFKRSKDFYEFMKIIQKSRKIHGNSFSLTLIGTKDIK